MADFAEVMRQLNRLCSHYQNCGESGCPMFDECGNIGAHCSDLKHSYRIEKTVMAWAAENPEPQYPLWGDYLQTIIPHGSRETALTFAIYAMQQPIPADIAQKLGIEPKE